jgi:hypothetical protein
MRHRQNRDNGKDKTTGGVSHRVSLVFEKPLYAVACQAHINRPRF